MLALCPALIWGCWSARFLEIDDCGYLSTNRVLQPDARWSELWSIYSGQPYYYPLTLLSWRIDRVVWTTLLGGIGAVEPWAAGVRITNLLLHVLASIFVWLLMRQLRASARLAAFVMLAFALHPTACESVCWPVERKNVLAGCLALCAIWLYMRARTFRGHVPAALCYMAALLAKPSALGALPIIICWELLGRPTFDMDSGLPQLPSENPRAQRPDVRARLASAILPIALWTAAALGNIWITLRLQTGSIMPPPGGSIGTALLTDVVVLWRYARNFLLPDSLSFYYGIVPVVSVRDSRLWLSAGGLLLIAGALAVMIGPGLRRMALFGALWFVAALGPNLNLVGINDLMHDRFVYLSAPGFWLVVGLAVSGLPARLPSIALLRSSRLAALALIALALLWAAASCSRGFVFRSSETLLAQATVREPDSSYAWLFHAGDLRNSAVKLMDTDRDAECRPLLEQCYIELRTGMALPDYDRFQYKAAALVDLAYLHYWRGELDAATTLAGRVLEMNERDLRARDHSKAEQVLGLVALARSDTRLAMHHFNMARLQTPRRGAVYLALAKTLLQIQRNALKSGDAAYATCAFEEAKKALRCVEPGWPEHAAAQTMLRKLQ